LVAKVWTALGGTTSGLEQRPTSPRLEHGLRPCSINKMVDMSGMIRDKVKYMFELSDRDGNGRLDKVGYAAVRCCDVQSSGLIGTR